MTNEHEAANIEITQSAAVEQYKLLMQHLPQIIGASTITFCIMVYYLYSMTSNTFLLFLLGLFFILSLFRALSYLKHRRIPVNVDNLQSRQYLAAFFSLASGSLWGYLGLIGISDNDSETRLFLSLIHI